jgi:hypothetical protein
MFLSQTEAILDPKTGVSISGPVVNFVPIA